MPEFTTDWFSHNITALETHVLNVKATNILEIGSWEGRSTLWFLQNFPDARLTCVDTFQGGKEHADLDTAPVEARFRANIAEYAHRVWIRKGPSRTMLFGLHPETYDLVYVDGSHQAPDVLTDLVMAWHLLKPGGVMAIDDYLWAEDGVRVATDAFVHMFRPHLEILAAGYQVYLRKL